MEHEDHVIHTGEIAGRLKIPDYGHRLPKEIAGFTQAGVYDADAHQHLSFIQGAGHGGSHPHLAHEFLNALVEGKQSYPNARQSANITCVGILGIKNPLIPSFFRISFRSIL